MMGNHFITVSLRLPCPTPNQRWLLLTLKGYVSTQLPYDTIGKYNAMIEQHSEEGGG